MAHKIINDFPASKLALNFGTLGECFAEIILESQPRFAIGVFGGWGSGKTTLMGAIRRELNGRSEDVVCVEFSAWRYEKEPYLIIPLLDLVRAALVEWSDRRTAAEKSAAKEMATVIGKVVASLVAGLAFKVGLPGSVELQFDSSKAMAVAAQIGDEQEAETLPSSVYHGCFIALKKSFERFRQLNPKRRIVVFVDDLDRCLPEGALAVLESMKLFFDLEGFVFVVGLDRNVVTTAIEAKYRRSDIPNGAPIVSGAEYVKKIFTVPYSLPRVEVADLDDYLEKVCEENAIQEPQRSEITQSASSHLTALATDAGLNPREIKRFLNAYSLQRNLSQGRISPDVLLAAVMIAFRDEWDSVRNAFQAYGDDLATALQQSYGGGEALADPLDELGIEPSLPASFLAYVTPGNPGNALLTQLNIAHLLRLGESTQSRDPILANLRKELQKARRLLYRAESAPDFDLKSMSEQIDQIRTALGHGGRASLEASDAAFGSSRRDAFFPIVEKWTNDVGQDIRRDSTSVDRKLWIGEALADLDAIVKELALRIA